MLQNVDFYHLNVQVSERRLSPRTRLRGSLMLTVWSWEAERELLMDLSAVR